MSSNNLISSMLGRLGAQVKPITAAKQVVDTVNKLKQAVAAPAPAPAKSASKPKFLNDAQVEHLAKVLRIGTWQIVFVDSSGVMKTITATLDPALLPQKTTADTASATSGNVIRFWSADRAGWRAISKSRVVMYSPSI